MSSDRSMNLEPMKPLYREKRTREQYEDEAMAARNPWQKRYRNFDAKIMFLRARASATRHVLYWEHQGWQWWDTLSLAAKLKYCQNMKHNHLKTSPSDVYQILTSSFKHGGHLEMIDNGMLNGLHLDPESESDVYRDTTSSNAADSESD